MLDQNVSFINENLTITGELKTAGALKVLGSIVGNSQCDSIIVAVMGVITGDITAKTVTVYGTVTGNISAETVYLKASSSLLGNVKSVHFTIEEGAKIEGALSIAPQKLTQSSVSS